MRVRPLIPLLVLGLAGSGAGCGSGQARGPADPPGRTEPATSTTSARADLAARTAAAQDLVTVSLYALTPPGGDDRTVMVVRAGDGGWRVDVEGGALGGAVDIAIVTTGDGLFHCTLPSVERPEASCVPLERLTAEVDPRVQHVFTDWLDVLTDRAAALAVSAAAPLPEVAGDCFAVQPSSASLVAPVDAGIYCYDPDGTLTGARLGLGELRLVSTGETAPPTIDLPGPVVTGADPLPTASPPPPTPTASPPPPTATPPPPT